MTAAPARWVMDVLLALGTTLVLATIIAADVTGVDPSGWSYLWAVGFGALLLVRRRYPVAVVFVTAALVIGYHAVGNPPIGVSVPLAAAAFSAAECGRARASIQAAAALLLVSVGYRLWEGQDAAFVVGFELPGRAVLLAGVIAFGDSVNSRRQSRRHSVEIAALQSERQAREAEEQRLAERLDLARELHDSVGHALTVVTLHAQVADESLGEDEATVRRSLQVIMDTTSTTFQDVRRTVAGLRQEGRGVYPVRGLVDLESALAPARQAGLQVSQRVEVTSTLSTAVQSAIYRIVQESITNVVRHAQGGQCRVMVEERENMVHVMNCARSRTPTSSATSSRDRSCRRRRERGHRRRRAVDLLAAADRARGGRARRDHTHRLAPRRRAGRRARRRRGAADVRQRRLRAAARDRRQLRHRRGADQRHPAPRGSDGRPAQPRRRADDPGRAGPRDLRRRPRRAAWRDRRVGADGQDRNGALRRRRPGPARQHRRRRGPSLRAGDERRGARRPGDRRDLPDRHGLRPRRARRHQPHPASTPPRSPAATAPTCSPRPSSGSPTSRPSTPSSVEERHGSR